MTTQTRKGELMRTSKQIIDEAERDATTYADKYCSEEDRKSFLIGILQAEIEGLCRELQEVKRTQEEIDEGNRAAEVDREIAATLGK